jgi:hypothetical protein
LAPKSSPPKAFSALASASRDDLYNLGAKGIKSCLARKCIEFFLIFPEKKKERKQVSRSFLISLVFFVE